MWDELAIAPTADETAIRRGYAARLKTLDVDRDRDAFIRLRRAYEAAIAQARVDRTGGDGIEPRADRQAAFDVPQLLPDEPAPKIGRGEPDWRAPRGALKAFRLKFERLCGDGDSKGAVATLQTALAKGVVPLGAEIEFMRKLENCVLADPKLASEDLDRIADSFGAAASARFDGARTDVARRLRERADAARWQARITADAQRGDGRIRGLLPCLLSRRTRVARAVRDVANKSLFSLDLPALRVEVVNARRYAAWQSTSVDPVRLEEKLLWLEKHLWANEILAVICAVAFIVSLFVAPP